MTLHKDYLHQSFKQLFKKTYDKYISQITFDEFISYESNTSQSLDESNNYSEIYGNIYLEKSVHLRRDDSFTLSEYTDCFFE